MKNLDIFSKKYRIEVSALDLIQFRALQILMALSAVGLVALMVVLSWRGIVEQWRALWP
jgi:hypothetical protein